MIESNRGSDSLKVPIAGKVVAFHLVARLNTQARVAMLGTLIKLGLKLLSPTAENSVDNLMGVGGGALGAESGTWGVAELTAGGEFGNAFGTKFSPWFAAAFFKLNLEGPSSLDNSSIGKQLWLSGHALLTESFTLCILTAELALVLDIHLSEQRVGGLNKLFLVLDKVGEHGALQRFRIAEMLGKAHNRLANLLGHIL